MRLVGVGGGRFEMLDGSSGQEIRRKPEFVDRAPTAPRSRPTGMAQAARASQERRRDAQRLAEQLGTAEQFGAAEPAYRPARFLDLVADECKWPIDPGSGPGQAGDLRCGAKQAPGPGLPYCEHHRALSSGRA